MSELSRPFDAELWQRLNDFTIGPADAVLDFTARLARENGWDRVFAERVVLEYKRFLYLAVRAGHVVTPSEELDQAWHLHLCYTRSYWDELCGEVLMTPLHHGPTSGGLAEGERYEGFYERTLESYQEHFAQAPPADIWPSAEERFVPPAARWVDTSRVWLLPKPALLRGSRLPNLARLSAWAHSPSPTRSIAVAVGALVITTSCMGSVLDWKGSSFLALYVGLLVGGYFLSVLLESWMRPEGEPFHVDDLDPYELAFLGGGAARTFEAALAVAVRSGAIEVASRSLRRGEVEPAAGWPATVVDAMPQTRSVPAAKLRASLKAKFIRLRSDLQKRGALLRPSQAKRLMAISAAPLVAVGLLGISKVFVGIERDRPVGFLVLLLGLTVLLVVMRTAGLNRRSGRGNRAWSEAERSSSQINKKDLNDQQLPVAVALMGISSLGLSEFARLRQSLRGVKSSSSFGCGTGCAVYSSSGDSGGSGCSGGGSGCGGGGCGGCGGCGG